MPNISKPEITSCTHNGKCSFFQLPSPASALPADQKHSEIPVDYFLRSPSNKFLTHQVRIKIFFFFSSIAEKLGDVFGEVFLYPKSCKTAKFSDGTKDRSVSSDFTDLLLLNT